jgi:hypothetical protein
MIVVVAALWTGGHYLLCSYIILFHFSSFSHPFYPKRKRKKPIYIILTTSFERWGRTDNYANLTTHSQPGLKLDKQLLVDLPMIGTGTKLQKVQVTNTHTHTHICIYTYTLLIIIIIQSIMLRICMSGVY